MNAEKVTISLGVPTIWLLLLNHLRDSGKKIDTVKRTGYRWIFMSKNFV
jgi:fatty-acyl-CoA synthase